MLEERSKHAFVFASDTTKQLIGLASAILTLTITFQPGSEVQSTEWSPNLLLAAWILFVGWIIFGVLTLMALTSQLGHGHDDEPPSVLIRWIVIPSRLQVLLFVLGTILIVWFGSQMLNAMS
jgi:hypothetical protein